MRLFIAIDLPEEVKILLSKLKTNIPGARWLPVDQLHLTLSFLGEVEESTANSLISELLTIKSPAFELAFFGLGCFPSRRQPRVLWAGLETEPLLSNLSSLVRRAAVSCSIPQEERPFSAHITLARLKTLATREVAAFLDQPKTEKIPSFTVQEFILFQSRLTPSGAIHLPLKTFALLSKSGDL